MAEEKAKCDAASGADADAITVGRAARETVRLASWATKQRSNKPSPGAAYTY